MPSVARLHGNRPERPGQKGCYPPGVTTHIYFDLDGTLTDPYEGISRSIRYALDRFGAEYPDEADMRRFIGPPLLETFAELLGERRAATALGYYRRRFAEIGWQENQPYPGIDRVLAELVAGGARLLVATSKPRVFAERIVEHFGLARHFERVYGSEFDGTRTDKTDLLAFALDGRPRTPRTIMIGDRKHDMLGAINNKLFAVGAAWGYGSIDELEAAGARCIAHSPDELSGLIIES